MNKFALIGFAGLSALAAMPASAVTTIYSGQDNGVGPGGAYTNSKAAEAQFLAAASAFGTVKTEGFENTTPGYYTPVVLEDFSISYSTPNFGTTLSGVNNTQYGTAIYGFNITDGGTNWLGFPDFFNSAATFNFDSATHSFGFFLTGVQEIYTSQITLELLDGSFSTFSVPINTDGGVTYFGVTDTIGFTAVYLSQTNNPGYSDAYGIDDISYNDTLTPTVPEAATWAMLITGFGMVGFAARRRTAARTAA